MDYSKTDEIAWDYFSIRSMGWILTIAVAMSFGRSGNAISNDDTKGGERLRTLVSTDIGGTDPDDFQSLVHLLLYADSVDIEGLISSPYGPGRKEHILQVIQHYEHDYANLKKYSNRYPTPDALRSITKQGEKQVAPYAGVRSSTEGSNWIIHCAKREDPRPLHVLVWGGLEDLAQSLHDSPEILPKLRVYWIGGPNKKWSPDAYQYLVEEHPDLWMIESNSSYRGWFVGGNQNTDFGNKSFVSKHIAGKGALGDFFVKQLGGTIKMGDSPSVGWLLVGNPSDPTHAGWGGRFQRASERPYARFDRLTSDQDRLEQFGILELRLSTSQTLNERTKAQMHIENQMLDGFVAIDGTMRFRFSPKEAKTYRYTIHSEVADLDGKSGSILSVAPSAATLRVASARLPYWWTDLLDETQADGIHFGAKTVSVWRQAYLSDFADRMLRCQRRAAD